MTTTSASAGTTPETIQSLLSLWTADAQFDATAPDKELAKLGSLHAKYLTILSQHRLAAKTAEHRYFRLRKLKLEYYAGKLNGNTEILAKYQWEPFIFTLKSEIPAYLDADRELQSLQTALHLHQEMVEVCQSILKELNSRTFQIKDYIVWQRYLQGL